MNIYCQECKKSFCVAEVSKDTLCPQCQTHIIRKGESVLKIEANKAYCLECETIFGVPSSQEVIKCPKCQSRNKTKPLWHSPLEEDEVLEGVKSFMDSNICYGEDKILGFPGTPPHPISTAVMANYCDRHPNNIGLHTNTGKCEVGFPGTQEAEREVVAMLAELMDADYEEIDGYISPGGTEANIVGCWMGRDARKGEKAAIICSFLTHYSLKKAANLLGIECYDLGTNQNGHVLMHQLKEKIDQLVKKKGVNNIIVVGSAGTTMLGSVDNIPTMNKIIEKARKSFSWVNIHFHIDAAFGGFIVPFINHLPRIGFSNECVDSVAIDAHKMGLTPYGSGVIMARKGLFERIRTDSPYVPGNDHTLCGSRPGVMALSCWAVMKRLGKAGYEKMATELVSLADQTRKEFEENGIETFSNDINIVAIKGSFPNSCQEDFITHTHEDFPADMANPDSEEKTSIWNVVVMPHTTKELIKECILAIRKEG